MPPTAPAPAHTAACASIPSTPPHHPSSAAPLRFPAAARCPAPGGHSLPGGSGQRLERQRVRARRRSGPAASGFPGRLSLLQWTRTHMRLVCCRLERAATLRGACWPCSRLQVQPSTGSQQSTAALLEQCKHPCCSRISPRHCRTHCSPTCPRVRPEMAPRVSSILLRAPPSYKEED